MDQRELESYVKALNKAVTTQEPAANIVTILQKLKKDVVPTEELLRATKAGVIVAKQRAHADKSVARLAGEIVASWRKSVDANKAKNPKKTSTSSPAPNGAASSPAAATPSSTASKSFKGDKSKRRNTSDGVDTDRTDSKVRNGAITLFYNGLAYMSEEAPDKVLAKAVEVEKALLDAHGGETEEYKKKTRALFSNLKHAKNRELGPRVLSGAIPASRFVIMTDDELKSAEMKETDAKLSKENMKMAQVPMAEKSISDALKCGKCGQKKVSYSQAQTRSADEPMTTFCECTVCGNRWKFS